MKSKIKLFADDTKLYGPAKTDEDCQTLQNDINALQDWADRWQMQFHPKKCKFIRIGKDHAEYTYKMVDGTEQIDLENTAVEKDLVVHTDKNLSFDEHINVTVKKAKQLVGMIKRSLHYLSGDVVTLLFKSMVRPMLKYGHSVWNPHLKKHIVALESVQRRATKIIPALTNLSYGERLKKLRLPSLEYRRRRGDMIET